MPFLVPKNATKWIAPSGTGFFSPSNGGSLTTLSGNTLITLSGNSLIVNTELYAPKSHSQWALTGKNDAQWIPSYIQTQGTLNLTDNHGNLFTDNSGNFLVTTSIYRTPKYLTQWANTGV